MNNQLIDKFVSVPYRALFFDGLSNSDALLYGYLNGFARAFGKDSDERIVWESTRSIATKLNLSPTTVGECIKHLESAGLLKVQRAKGKPTVICVLHDLKDSEDRFGLEDEEDEEFDDSELEWLPNYAKDAIRAWREEDTEDEDSEQREWVDDVEDRVNSRSSTLPDDEDSFFVQTISLFEQNRLEVYSPPVQRIRSRDPLLGGLLFARGKHKFQKLPYHFGKKLQVVEQLFSIIFEA